MSLYYIYLYYGTISLCIKQPSLIERKYNCLPLPRGKCESSLEEAGEVERSTDDFLLSEIDLLVSLFENVMPTSLTYFLMPCSPLTSRGTSGTNDRMLTQVSKILSVKMTWTTNPRWVFGIVGFLPMPSFLLSLKKVGCSLALISCSCAFFWVLY